MCALRRTTIVTFADSPPQFTYHRRLCALCTLCTWQAVVVAGTQASFSSHGPYNASLMAFHCMSSQLDALRGCGVWLVGCSPAGSVIPRHSTWLVGCSPAGSVIPRHSTSFHVIPRHSTWLVGYFPAGSVTRYRTC